MAYVANNQNTQEEEQTQQPGESQMIGSGGGLIGDTGTAGSTNASNGSQATTAQSGTGFANLKSYLDANENQTKNLADNVTNKLGQERQGFLDNVSNAGSAFNNALNERKTINQTMIDQAAQNPSSIGDDKLDMFKNLRDNQYSGPGSIQDDDSYRSVQNDYSKLLDRSDLTSNETGRSALLNEYTQNPTRGQNALDQYLLQNNDYSKQKLGDFRTQVQGDQSALDNLVSSSTQNVDAYKQSLADASQDLNNRFFGEGTFTRNADTGERTWNDDAGLVTSFDRDVSSRYNDALSQLMGNYNDRYKGADDVQWQDPTAFAQDKNIALEDFVSADDFAREAEFERLFGEQDILNNANVNRAGGWEALIEQLMSAPQRAVARNADVITRAGGGDTTNADLITPGRGGASASN